eukprot:gene56719-biopygen53059
MGSMGMFLGERQAGFRHAMSVMSGELPVSHPSLWKHGTARRWVFSSTDAKWCIGGIEERRANFNCASGHIRSLAPHGRLMPHEVSGWEVQDVLGWNEDRDVSVQKSDGRESPRAHAPLNAPLIMKSTL